MSAPDRPDRDPHPSPYSILGTLEQAADPASAQPPSAAARDHQARVSERDEQPAPTAARYQAPDPDLADRPVRPRFTPASELPASEISWPRPPRGRADDSADPVRQPERAAASGQPLAQGASDGLEPLPEIGERPPGRGQQSQATARSLPVGRGPGFNPNVGPPRIASDGSWTWGPARLTLDLVRIADDGYDRFRAQEGRDLFGAYSSSGLTAKLRQIEERLEHGELAPQTEEHALLDREVFRARFADMLRRHPDRTPELLADRVPGALSYAYIFSPNHYADGIVLVQDALEAQGFELQARKNSWSSAANRCVFTMWHDPLSEVPFAVPFHTSASLEAQQLARTSATLINDPRIPPDEAASLRSDLASTWAAVPSPPGHSDIGDYRRYGSASRH